MKNNVVGYLVVVAILAAAFVFWLRGVGTFDWARFWTHLEYVDPGWLSAGALLVGVSYLGRAIRWQLMLRPLRPQANFGGILSATAIGFTATVLFGRAGEFVRPYLIARQEGVSVSSQIAVWVVERICDLLMVLALFGFALTLVKKIESPSTAMIMQAGGWTLGIMSGVCLLALAGFRYFNDGLRQRLMEALAFLPEQPKARISGFLDSFGQGMMAARDTRCLLLLILYSVIEWVVLVLCGYFVLRALPATASLTPADAIVVLGFVAFGNSVQLPGIGGGSQVATLFVLTELYQVPPEGASAAALFLWIVNIVTIVPFGLVLAFHQGLHWKEMRTWEQPAV
jgi:glycosyltransferase 2 family protein